MNLDAVRSALAHAVRQLRGAGIDLSDRRIVRMQRLVAAAAAVAGHTDASMADLWPIVFVLPTEQAQQIGRETLREMLGSSENRALPNAALEASLGLAARATKIVEEGHSILAARPTSDAGDSVWASFRLRVEGLAREIDATFPKEALGPELASLRERVVEVLAKAPERSA
jgi:MoxR-like ATPase